MRKFRIFAAAVICALTLCAAASADEDDGVNIFQNKMNNIQK